MSVDELDLTQIEEHALAGLEEADDVLGEGAESALEEWEVEPPLPPLRVGIVVACSTIAAAVMIGSVFEGLNGRVYPALAGMCGIGVAAQASRRRGAIATNATIILGIIATGIVLVIPAGFDNLTKLVGILKEATQASRVLRPPAELLPGYRVILGWLMGSVGFAAGWVGIELRRPALGLLVPLPLIAMGAISVPDDAKLAAGLVCLVLFIVGLALLSSLQNLTSGEGAAPGIGYEARRALRALPLVGVLVVLMVVLSRTNVLFPPPLYDPTRDSQAPKAVPLSEVQDKVLFQVRSRLTGPWRIGLLDIYDGTQWRLPPFSESKLKEVPKTGVVDSELDPGLRADFLVKGLGGAVLPGLPNTVAIIAQGPRLAYDPRTGNIRLVQGQIRDGLTYTVTGASLPTEEALEASDPSYPKDVRRFLRMPDPPPAVRALLDEAPKTPLWTRLEFVRRRFLETVTASGPGTPKPVPPQRVDDMLAGSKEGSPFEIVAAQAMLARWAGVPARMAYGYDGGDLVGEGLREIHPKHGASWLEVYFPNFKWFPLIGSPLKAKVSLNSEGPTNSDPNVQPSDEIAVQVYIPLRIEEKSLFYKQVQRILLLLLPVALVVLLLYFSFPAAAKAWRRSRRRAWAHKAGPAARVEVSYAEFRDLCTDFGAGHEYETPLQFLTRYVEDEEHAEFAWLVTRALWGDLRDSVGPDDANAAEELSRTLRRRVAQAQPLTLRVIAAVSRLSKQRPYAPDVGPQGRVGRKERRVEAA